MNTLSQRLAKLPFTWEEPFDIVVADSRLLHRPIGGSSMAAATREALWLTKLAASLRMTLSQAGVPIAIKVDNSWLRRQWPRSRLSRACK